MEYFLSFIYFKACGFDHFRKIGNHHLFHYNDNGTCIAGAINFLKNKIMKLFEKELPLIELYCLCVYFLAVIVLQYNLRKHPHSIITKEKLIQWR
jgi:hypothetical protein